MNVEISFIEEDNYLYVKTRGSIVSSDIAEGMAQVKEKVSQSGYRHILIDAFEITPPQKEFDKFLFGKTAAEIFPMPFKIAVLYKKEFTNKFSENTAVNRGARLFISSDKDEALRWLFKKE